MNTTRRAYRVHGMMQSYFTRKMTAYLDYKDIPWLFCRVPGVNPEAMAAGWPGGVPPVQTPDGELRCVRRCRAIRRTRWCART